ncbi:MAG: sigma-70 family RNA polymerase sigma factor [bacterium]|nr:sigma-70 family RNA polymerase sigma factor [bacterium]
MEQGELSAGDLLLAIRAGDDRHWPELVDRFSSMVVAIAARYRLSEDEIDDVYQAVWLRVAENLDRIREPSAFPGWIKTTAKNEALRVARQRSTDYLTEEPKAQDKSVERLVEESELMEIVATAMAGISERCRNLLRLLLVEKRSYVEVCELLSMPVGSIGPIRQRCLGYLRREILALNLVQP